MKQETALPGPRSLLAFAQVPGLLQNGMSETLTIGFLGAGKMGTALARGFIRAGLVNAGNIIASDPVEAARAALLETLDLSTLA